MILYNANLVTLWPAEPHVPGALIAIEGKSIVDFGKMGKLIDRYDDAETLDVGGRVVMPGMIDAHARLSRRLFVGTSADPAKFECALDVPAIHASASVALMDAVRSGVTTVFALHASPSCVGGSLEELRRAFTDVGVRGSVAYAVSAESDVDAAIDENASGLAQASEMFRGLFGLRVSLELDDRQMKRGVERADELGARLHVSLAHRRDELDSCLSQCGVTPIVRLGKLGLWNRRGFSAYAPHRLPADEAVLRESGVWLVDCPLSGTIGAAPSPELAHLRASECLVATGTEGFGPSMLEEFRRSALRQRARGTDLKSAIRLAFWSSFQGNADMATAHFGPPLGCIRPGARADLVVLDYVPATPLDASNVADHLFFSSSMGRVHTVVVNGRILYQNGEFAHLDEARLRARASEISNELWERI